MSWECLIKALSTFISVIVLRQRDVYQLIGNLSRTDVIGRQPARLRPALIYLDISMDSTQRKTVNGDRQGGGNRVGPTDAESGKKAADDEEENREGEQGHNGPPRKPVLK